MHGIETFCEVETWYMTMGRQAADFCILGLASDAEYASYLVESLTTFALGKANVHIAVERKMAIARGTPFTPADSREAHRSFLIGCANRVSVRIREMAAERKARATKPGSYGALVTLDKPTLVSAEMERLDIRLHSGSSLTGARAGSSFAAGDRHGTQATFGRPVGGGRIAGLIGRDKDT
jgi:hypothetical protein